VNSQNGQTPFEESQERLAEATPALVAGRLIALEDYRASQRAYRQRVAQAAAAGWAVMGNNELAEATLKAAEEAEGEMGGISLRGDTIYNNFVTKPTEKPAPTPTPTPPATSTVTDWLKPALIGAALLGTGGGTVALWDYYNNETTTQPAATDVDQDWKFGIQVRDRE
jgi:hypothetical protein